MTIHLPEQVNFIIHTLENAGYEAYAVGGCIRDSFLGREPDDWDITTSAAPEQVKELFRRTIDTGIRHGTVTVMLGADGYEVTTYRIDGEYEDGRHPKEVIFTASLEEDLKRRDFTMNALAYNERSGLVDCFGGIRDMQQGLVRAVGDPGERFEEDALRMMRAVRFAAQLNYTIEENTRAAIQRLAERMSCVSAERIQTELVKLIVSAHPEKLRLMYETKLTAVILPEWDAMMRAEQNNPHHCYTVGEHTLHALEHTPADRIKRLAILFHDMGKPAVKTTDNAGCDHFHAHAALSRELAEQILRRLKFDNETIDKVTRLVLWHDYKPELTEGSIRRGIHKIGEDVFPLLFDIQRADILAQNSFMREEKLDALERMQAIYRHILEERQCLSLKDLAVSGKDLISLGMSPGREIGEALEIMLDWVLEHPQDNRKEVLTALPAVTQYFPS